VRQQSDHQPVSLCNTFRTFEGMDLTIPSICVCFGWLLTAPSITLAHTWFRCRLQCRGGLDTFLAAQPTSKAVFQPLSAVSHCVLTRIQFIMKDGCKEWRAWGEFRLPDGKLHSEAFLSEFGDATVPVRHCALFRRQFSFIPCVLK
jgi:hypothetical protein